MNPSRDRILFVRPKNPANAAPNAVFRQNGPLVVEETDVKENNGITEVYNNAGATGAGANHNGNGLSLDCYLPPPVGLINNGTVCFFNASLQCLLACPIFVQFLLELQEFVPERKDACDILDMLSDHVKIVKNAMKNKPLDVYRMLLAVRKSSKGAISINRQEDSHESLCVLFDMMEKSCLIRLGLPVTTRVDRTSESTPIHKIFGGSLGITTTCPNCGHSSPKVETFLQLSLELDHTRSLSIPELLKKMTTVEKLDAKNLWECDKCKRKVMAERKTDILNTPNVLIIHLKRFGFSFDNGVMRRTKLKTPVLVPSDVLVVEAEKGKKVIYDLVGVLVHQGASVHSGHYFSFVKCRRNMQWYVADDDEISRIGSGDVRAQKEAYMLFYEKRLVDPIIRLTNTVRNTYATTTHSPTATQAVAHVKQNGTHGPESVVVKADTAAAPSTTTVRAAVEPIPVTSNQNAMQSESTPVKAVADNSSPDMPTADNATPGSAKSNDSLMKLTQSLRKSPFWPTRRMRIKHGVANFQRTRRLVSHHLGVFAEALKLNGLRRQSKPSRSESDESPSKRLKSENPVSIQENGVDHQEAPQINHPEDKREKIDQPHSLKTPMINGTKESAHNVDQNGKESSVFAHDDAPFSFDIKEPKRKQFQDAWDKHLDKGKVKKSMPLL